MDLVGSIGCWLKGVVGSMGFEERMCLLGVVTKQWGQLTRSVSRQACALAVWGGDIKVPLRDPWSISAGFYPRAVPAIPQLACSSVMECDLQWGSLCYGGVLLQ